MPGRVRLRIAECRGDGVFFAAVATGLSTIAGVHKVEVRPLTGSVLIAHGPPLDHIGAAAKKARLFAVGIPSSVSSPVLSMPLEPKLIIGVGLGVFALWQLAQGRVLPPAVTLGWYAANLTGLLTNGDSADGGE